jgi:hypothetical protein
MLQTSTELVSTCYLCPWTSPIQLPIPGHLSISPDTFPVNSVAQQPAPVARDHHIAVRGDTSPYSSSERIVPPQHYTQTTSNQQEYRDGATWIYLPAHGYIIETFGYAGARAFFSALLKVNIDTISGTLDFSYVPGLPETYSVVQGSLPISNSRVSQTGIIPALDYAVDPSWGPVVPQVMWEPQSVLHCQRYVAQARLEKPIFFVHRDGTIGVAIGDAVSGNCATLRGFLDMAPLGEQTSKHFCIQVNLCHTHAIHSSLICGKWPGYRPYKRQFQTRDQTFHRSTISLKRLIAYCGRTTKIFFNVRCGLLH